MRTLLITLAAVMTLSGCALFKTANPTAEQLIIQELTAVGIQAGCSTPACYDARAAKVAAIAKILESATTSMALTDLQNAVAKELIALKLTPEEIAPINALVNGLFAYLTPLAGTSQLTASVVTTINTVAGWVETVAAEYST